MAYEKLRYDVADGVATIALDHPETRNALSDAMLEELLAAFAAARADDGVRCVVLASTHEKVFSSGGDLDGFTADVALVQRHAANDRFPRLFELMGRLGKPIVCAAGGHVLAGGLGLALACDLVVASERATFGTPEINVGLFPFMIAALIGRNIGRKKMNELLFLGGRMDAREAQAIGLVNRVSRPTSSTRPSRSGRRRSRRSPRSSSSSARTRSTRSRTWPSARRSSTCVPSWRSRCPRRTSARASRPSWSVASRRGPAGSRSTLPHVRPRP